MKLYNRRMGAAALALILILSVSPIRAAEPQDREERAREKIARIIQSIKKHLGQITTLNDLPMPPKP